MVKGVSRQVIVVRPQDGKLYEQAIFILHEDAVDVTDEMLLREAVQLTGRPKRKLAGWIWACAGAACTAAAWGLTVLL